jgi:hypothetical protein
VKLQLEDYKVLLKTKIDAARTPQKIADALSWGMATLLVEFELLPEDVFQNTDSVVDDALEGFFKRMPHGKKRS